jgi:carboxyl-terminal processing protease
MKALIFDLRNNPGGLLNISQDIASRFIDSGPIVWVKQKSGQMDSLNVRPNKHRSSLFKGEYPLMVLVNGSSASASEIVSGAIQDAGVGKLLGTTTFGKGLVQTIFPLDSGDSAVKITTQHYFTRNKHDINRNSMPAANRSVVESSGLCCRANGKGSGSTARSSAQRSPEP